MKCGPTPCLLVTVILCANIVRAQKKPIPLPIDDVGVAQSLSSIPVDISPDGRWVAFTSEDSSRYNPGTDENPYFTRSGVTRALGRRKMEVWVSNTNTRELRNLSADQGSSWAPVWSPDGQRLAFYTDRDGQANVWVWERATGRVRRVSDVIARPFFGGEVIRWSPDGRKVLCKALPEGMTLEDAAKLIPTRANADQQEGNPKNENGPSIFVLRSSAESTATKGAGASPSGFIQYSIDNLYLSDLVILDIDSNRVERIASKVKPLWYSFSPDGAHVVFTHIKGREHNSFQRVFDLLDYSLVGGTSRLLASDIRLQEASMSWSAEGKMLSYVASGNRAEAGFFVVSIQDGTSRRLVEADRPDFAGDGSAPLWDAGGKTLYFVRSAALWRITLSTGAASEVARIPKRTILRIISRASSGRFWSPDGGRTIVVITRDDETKHSGFYKVDLESGVTTKLLEENKAYGGGRSSTFDITDDERTVVYQAEDAQHAPDLWIAEKDFHNPRRITNMMGTSDKYLMGESRLIEWRGVDGERLRGALMLPASYSNGKRYPLVVWVYGGQRGSDFVNRFGFWGSNPTFNLQILATRGYAVLYPDAPLKTGTLMKDLANTVLPGVNKAIDMGIADPERLAIMGQSFGSYCTLALITQTTRFKAAAVTAVAPVDLMTGYLLLGADGNAFFIPYYEEGQGGMGGSPWQHRDRYIENSPIFYFDKIKTPLLMAHGTADDSQPLHFPDQTFVALRRLGKEVEYVRYKGDGHVIQGNGNVQDLWIRRIEWFDKWLDISRDQQGNLLWDGEKVKPRTDSLPLKPTAPGSFK